MPFVCVVEACQSQVQVSDSRAQSLTHYTGLHKELTFVCFWDSLLNERKSFMLHDIEWSTKFLTFLNNGRETLRTKFPTCSFNPNYFYVCLGELDCPPYESFSFKNLSTMFYCSLSSICFSMSFSYYLLHDYQDYTPLEFWSNPSAVSQILSKLLKTRYCF